MKKLGFGLMRLPLCENADDSVDMQQVCEMVDTFIENGFTYFDTAYMYHQGKSEEIAREALVKRHSRDSFTLATKMPLMFLKEQSDVERIFNEQLTRCGVDYFDYYLMHNMDYDNYQTAKKFSVIDFAMQKKREGKIKHLGFSFHDSAKVLDNILSEHDEFEFVQLQLNYLDWESINIQSRLCYETACAHGIPVIVMEPVKGGLLASVPESAKTLFDKFDSSRSYASWAIRYVASLDNVMMVLSGMSNAAQLADNISFMKSFAPLTEAEQNLIVAATDAIKKSVSIPCTACQYCTEGCPKHIPIPKYFQMYNIEKQFVPSGYSTQREGYMKLASKRNPASACIECGQCVSACPQHIDIIGELGKVRLLFE